MVHQSVSPEHYDVLVVDNNSTDNTYEIAFQFEKNFGHIRLVKELRQGLSHARNRGYEEAQTPWVSYVDDDAKAYFDYVERALWVIENFNFDCFGGMYYAWNKYGRPNWLPKDYGTKAWVQDEVGIMQEDKFASGGVIVFRKKVLEDLGGFDPTLGMSGKKVSYGEETHLQIRMREQGYQLGFDPELKIEHLVAKYKLSLWWHLKSNFIKGQTLQRSYNVSSSRDNAWYLSKYALKRLIENTKKCKLYHKDVRYSWGNYLYDILTIFFLDAGVAWGAYKNKNKNG